MVNIGWIIIFLQFDHVVGTQQEHSYIYQENEVVYQTLRECSEDVMSVAKKRFPQASEFGVGFYGENKERIEVTTVNQTDSSSVLHHKFRCLEIKGFDTQ
jgi:hypothetical protein